MARAWGEEGQNNLISMEEKTDQRCECNRLLCVIQGNIIEIKCPKCKRIHRIYTKGIVRIESH